MADQHALRRVGLAFGAVTALIAMIAFTMVLHTDPDRLQTEAHASIVE
jgi:hypothetical protein